MRVLIVSSEVFPLAKTGGLADAVGALAVALARDGVQVGVVLPAYQSVLGGGFAGEETSLRVKIEIAGAQKTAAVQRTELANGVAVYLVREDSYFLRPGLYGDAAGDYPDNAERFAFFCKAALAVAEATAPWHIIHCHDWQSALIPPLLKTRPAAYPRLEKSGVIFTVHNLAHQGIFPADSWPLTGLEVDYFTPRYLEFYGSMNFLKGGVLFADALTTVSRRYAEEIKTPEYGCGLDGVIRERAEALRGILNGVDYAEWNPATDPYIKRKYSARDVRGKKACKKDLQESFGLLRRAETPILGMVSRLVPQKGLDLIIEILDALVELELQLVILGTGSQKYEAALADFSVRYPEKVAIRVGFDNPLAHKIEAGADIFLMPSQFEPCGLNQMYSLKYGTIPLVRATGGLDDTIQDYEPLSQNGNGFKFTGYSAPTLLEAVKRAVAVFGNDKAWRRLIANAMACDFSWDKSAAEYLSLYRGVHEKTETRPGRKAPALRS
jgi:starch synthase